MEVLNDTSHSLSPKLDARPYVMSLENPFYVSRKESQTGYHDEMISISLYLQYLDKYKEINNPL